MLLAYATRYYWRVRVWMAGGAATDWSEAAWFETALLHASDWQGQWIAGPERRVTRLTPAEGVADDADIIAAGEFCRPPQWPTAPNVPLIPATRLRTEARDFTRSGGHNLAHEPVQRTLPPARFSRFQ